MKLITVMLNRSVSTSQRRLLPAASTVLLTGFDTVACVTALALRSADWAELVSDKCFRSMLACRSGGIVVLDRQEGEQEFLHAVSLFKVRITGEDEVVDSEGRILQHALCDGLGIAHQSCPSPTADQPNAGPEIWAH